MRAEQVTIVDIPCTVRSGRGSTPDSTKQVSSKKHQEIKGLTGAGLSPGSLNLQPVVPLWLRSGAAINSSLGPLFTGWVGGFTVSFRPWPPRLRWGRPVAKCLVYSDQHLRQALRLRDGDRISLQIPKEFVKEFVVLERAVWVAGRASRNVVASRRRHAGGQGR